MEIAWRSRAFADESSSSASTAIVTTTSTRRHVGSAAHSLRVSAVFRRICSTFSPDRGLILGQVRGRRVGFQNSGSRR